MPNNITMGEVHINSTKIASRKKEEKFQLLHIPSDRFIELDEIGQRIWIKMGDGMIKIRSIIEEHSKESHIPNEVAAYQIITFLDELRSLGFIDFKLEHERDVAPLLDVPLLEISPQQRLQISQEPSFLKLHDDRKVVILESPHPEISLYDIVEIAKNITHNKIQHVEKAIVLEDPSSKFSIHEIPQIINEIEQQKTSTRFNLNVINEIQPDLSLKGLVHLANVDSLSAPRKTQALVIIVIIITDDTIIIIIIRTGPGPSAGKSRQACKTMCV